MIGSGIPSYVSVTVMSSLIVDGAPLDPGLYVVCEPPIFGVASFATGYPTGVSFLGGGSFTANNGIGIDFEQVPASGCVLDMSGVSWNVPTDSFLYTTKPSVSTVAGN